MMDASKALEEIRDEKMKIKNEAATKIQKQWIHYIRIKKPIRENLKKISAYHKQLVKL